MKHDGCQVRDVSRETRERLTIFRALLLQWNRSINLIGRSTEGDVDRRHFADCLQLAPYLPCDAEEGIDLGSGAGFPGLVLAIATGLRFVLVEADQRKAAFLREVIAATRAPASVRAERVDVMELGQADIVTARAFAPLDILLTYAHHLLKPSGVALFLKGAQAVDEIEVARQHWHMCLSSYQSTTSPSGAILKISELVRASA